MSENTTSFHARMMNIRGTPPKDAVKLIRQGYVLGHKEARHAAAEIANEADAELTRLRSENEQMRELADEAYLGIAHDFEKAKAERDQRHLDLLAMTAERDRMRKERNELLRALTEICDMQESHFGDGMRTHIELIALSRRARSMISALSSSAEPGVTP